MEYGCIGERLVHSFSKEIHSFFGGYDYRLTELAPESVGAFFAERDFMGINVTIPYKKIAFSCVDELSPAAAEIGAVNTVINRGGVLFGYNTDHYGLRSLIEKGGINLENRRVAVLGSGGTSETALCVCRDLGASDIIRVSRSPKENFITYSELKQISDDIDVIINTTPCGMFPGKNEAPLDISDFTALEAVADVVYNPLRTQLVVEAQKRGIRAVGGLYMLVSQAAKASSLFFGDEAALLKTDEVYKTISSAKRNVVLTGLPGCGKTTVGRLLAAELGRSFVDLDESIEAEAGMTVAEIFSRFGEPYFRELEKKAAAKVSAENGLVVAPGGGTLNDEENADILKGNGVLVYLDRDPSLIALSDERPLCRDRAELFALSEKRKKIYENNADITVKNNGTVSEAIKSVREKFNEYSHY